MGNAGVDERDFAIVVNSKMKGHLSSLSEVRTNDLYGLRAVVSAGVVRSIAGVEVLTSSFLREDTNATGIYDGSTTTKTQVIIFHKPSWKMGVRRQIRLGYQQDELKQASWLVASMRKNMQTLSSLTTTNPVAWLYNITA